MRPVSCKSETAFGGPSLRVVEEPAHVRGDRRREIAACLRGLYRVGPGRQPVQPHIHGPQAIHAFRENAVVEDDQRVVDGCTSLSECIAEGDRKSTRLNPSHYCATRMPSSSLHK